MRYQLVLAGVTALATSVAALPHANEHAHARAHARRQAVVTKVVTITASPVPAPDTTPSVANDLANPDFGVEKVGESGGPGGFTPRVTATGASVVTLPNGDKSVSHLEQTLGLSTAAQSNPSAAAAPPNSYGSIPANDPTRFSQDPSTGGPPTHPFEVIVNEPSQPGANNRDYPGTILLQHNFHRRNQSAPDLIWGFALQRTAQDLANKCVFEHDLSAQGGGYGQSIVAGVPADQIGHVVTDAFYNTQVSSFDGLYNQANPDMSNFNNWGFFTQVVWKATQQIGCYSVDCSSKGGLKGKPSGSSDDWTVCNYWPAGNVDGQYAENVGPAGNMPSMSWDTDSWPPKAP